MNWVHVIESSFEAMDQWLKSSDWHGRENEMVNIFAHRFVCERISPEGPLRSLRQVGLEVAVRQVTGSTKTYVRKDMVIWPQEDMTVWTPGASPAVIVEWKRNNFNKSDVDVDWLNGFLRHFPQTICYVACGFVVGERGVRFKRVLGVGTPQ